MNDALVELLLTWLLWLALFAATYIILLLIADVVLTRWQRHREVRRQRQAEIARINRDTAIAIQRMGVAFTAAQQLIRSETTRYGGRR